MYGVCLWSQEFTSFYTLYLYWSLFEKGWFLVISCAFIVYHCWKESYFIHTQTHTKFFFSFCILRFLENFSSFYESWFRDSFASSDKNWKFKRDSLRIKFNFPFHQHAHFNRFSVTFHSLFLRFSTFQIIEKLSFHVKNKYFHFSPFKCIIQSYTYNIPHSQQYV